MNKRQWAKRAATVTSDGVLELTIYDQIGSDWWTGGGITAKWVKAQIAEAGAVKRINVLINSPGGDAFEGIAIYNELKASKARVYVTVRGMALSAASIIAMAGNKITLNTGAMMMIHDAWSATYGFAEDFEKMAAMLHKLNGGLAAIYAERTGKAKEQFTALMKATTWLTGEEAKALGMADEVSSTPAEEPEPLFGELRKFGFKDVPAEARGWFREGDEPEATEEAQEAATGLEKRKAGAERRMCNAVEVRGDTTKGTIEGYAALFNVETEIKRGDFEVIRPGAFKAWLASDADVYMFWAHDDTNTILGRRANGTLKLWEDEKGLRFEATPPKTAEAADKVTLIADSYVDQMSFAFTVAKGGQKRAARAGGGTLRELTGLELWEVSPVPFAAYSGTTVTTRGAAAEEHGEAAEDSEPEGAPSGENLRAARLRLVAANIGRMHG